MRLLGVGGGYETNPRQEARLRGQRRVRSVFLTICKIMNASRYAKSYSPLIIVWCCSYFRIGRATNQVTSDACMFFWQDHTG